MCSSRLVKLGLESFTEILMDDKIVLLGGSGHLTVDGVRFQVAVIFSPIGELTFTITNLETGLQSAYLSIDAVSAVDLNDAQNAFYRGEFESEMRHE